MCGGAGTLAEQHPGCILLSGDNRLRSLAAKHGIDVHGVLWAMDPMHAAGTATVAELYAALRLFEDDPTVRLPVRDLINFLKRFKSPL